MKIFISYFRILFFKINFRFVNEEKLLEIEIEAGMKDGQEQKFVAEGKFFFLVFLFA